MFLSVQSLLSDNINIHVYVVSSLFSTYEICVYYFNPTKFHPCDQIYRKIVAMFSLI